MILYKLEIKEIAELGDGTKAFVFDRPEDFFWKEGAHIHVGLEGFDAGETNDKSLVRHMSVSSLSDENRVVFTTRVPGSGSVFKTKLAQLKAGDFVTLFKCDSRMMLRRENRPLVLVSMGVGIATMRPVILKYSMDASEISALTSININGSEDFVYKKELEELKTSGLTLVWTTSREEFYRKLDEQTQQTDPLFYLAGSDGFLQGCIAFLKERGIRRDQIILDKKEEKQIPFFEGWEE